MSIQPQDNYPIPEETRRVAQAAFPKGNLYMRMRDELGELYQDQQFAELFPRRGQPAESPGRLAWVTVMQFAEGLSDTCLHPVRPVRSKLPAPAVGQVYASIEAERQSARSNLFFDN